MRMIAKDPYLHYRAAAHLEKTEADAYTYERIYIRCAENRMKEAKAEVKREIYIEREEKKPTRQRSGRR